MNQPAPAPGPRAILLLGALAALLTGLVEVALLATVSFRVQGYIYLGPHALWMPVLADFVWFAPGVLVLAALAAWRPGAVSWSAAIGVPLTIAVLAGGLLTPKFHALAAFVLAVGIGVQGGRMLARRMEQIWPLVGRLTLVAGGLAAVLVAVAFGREALAERRARSGLAAAPSARFNVLLLVLDTVRRDHLGLYGYDRSTTPKLATWAARGVRFDRAMSTAPWTLPSHASMFTGRLPHELSVSWFDRLDAREPTLAERFAGQGYATGGFIANLLYCNRGFGLARGFAHYEDYPLSLGQVLTTSSYGRWLSTQRWVRSVVRRRDVLVRKSAADVNRGFLDWQARQGGRPFFGFINYFDAHQPYLPPQPFATRFGDQRSRNYGAATHQPFFAKLDDTRHLKEDEVDAERDAYDGAIAYLDEEISALLDTLQARGVLDQTIVVITSDHGEQFREHGLLDHGNSLYQQVLGVPLIIIGPRLPANVAAPEPVSLVDLGATMLDLSGDTTAGFPGRSLRRAWERDTVPRTVFAELVRAHRTERRRLSTVITPLWKAIWSDTGTVELYRTTGDPQELIDLSRDSSTVPVLRGLQVLRDSAGLRAGVGP